MHVLLCLCECNPTERLGVLCIWIGNIELLVIVNMAPHVCVIRTGAP